MDSLYLNLLNCNHKLFRIFWQMIPSLKLFGVLISWYWVVMASTIFISMLFFKSSIVNATKGEKYTLNTTSIFLLCILSCFVFSKFSYIIEYALLHGVDRNVIVNLLTHYQGMRSYGIIVGYVILCSIFYQSLLKAKLLYYFDVLGITGCLAIVIGKFACLLEGHGCYGTYTNLPWGMYFKYGNEPSLIPVHPTPLYDSILHLLLFFLLIKIRNSKTNDGVLFWIFILGTSANNIIVETVRNNEAYIGYLSVAQLFYLWCFITSCFFLKRQDGIESHITHNHSNI